MTSVEEKVIEVITRTLGRSAGDIERSDDSSTIAGWDSLNHENILLELNEAFEVSIDAYEGEELQSVQSLISSIEAKLRATKILQSAHHSEKQSHSDRMIDHPPYLLLSDSNARSFSYHAGYLPIMMAPGRSLNFLTPDTTKLTREIVLNLVSKANSSLPVALLLPGSVMHHHRDTFGTQTSNSDQSDSELMRHCALELSRLAEEVREISQSWVCVIGTPPLPLRGYTDLCMLHDRIIQELLEQTNIPFVDICSDLIDQEQGMLAAAYRADAYHVSTELSNVVAQELEKLDRPISAEENYSWFYDYRISGHKNTTSIWGDYPCDRLKMEDPNEDFHLTESGSTHSQIFRFQRYHHHTNETLQTLYSTIRFLVDTSMYSAPPSALVLDCKEGLIPLELARFSFVEILGIDKNPRRVLFAEEIAQITETKTCRFDCMSSYGDLTNLPDKDITFVFERWEYTESYLSALFLVLVKKCTTLAFRSVNAGSHISLLRNAGFAHVFEIPVVDELGAINLPLTRPVRSGRWTEQKGYHLLIATNIPLQKTNLEAATHFLDRAFDQGRQEILDQLNKSQERMAASRH